MCLLLYKPADVIIPKDRLYNGFTNNQDGAGFALCEKDKDGNPELNIYKGLFEWREFWKEWEPRQDKQAIVHFRNASVRQLVNGENTHPFRILPSPNDLVMAHNGYIYGLPLNNTDKYSDTAIFADMILKPAATRDADFWLMEEFKWFIENSIGSNNKLVMMDIQGRYSIFDESKGDWVDKVWYSNNDYSYKNHLYWDDHDDNDDLEFDGVSHSEVYGPKETETNVIDVEVEVEAEVEHARQAQEVARNDEFDRTPKREVVEVQREFTTYELEILDEIIEKENAARR